VASINSKISVPPRCPISTKKKSVSKTDTWHGYCMKHHKMLDGSIPKIVTNVFSSAPIGDFENTLSFPGEETSLESVLPSHFPKVDVPCPSSPSHGFLHHTIGTLNYALCINDITDSVILSLLNLRLRNKKGLVQ